MPWGERGKKRTFQLDPLSPPSFTEPWWAPSVPTFPIPAGKASTEPGVLYRCPLLEAGRPCTQVLVDVTGNQLEKNQSNSTAQQSVNYDYYYYAAEMGFSATFTKDGRLVLGAPGFYNWEGYSVTTGRLFRQRELTVAVGSPRSNDYKGQMCEYFGASLLAIDLDSDGVDDLLVGAPLYSIKDGQDEGRVYVFRSNGVGVYPSGHLEGHRATAARFGTAMANVGDLNMDGIQDVAVGAPYENDVGAVYIYHGSSTFGERTTYAQRIDASSISSRIGSPLKGFGISISKGLDVDSNHYDDVMIGSYMTDSAVVFRSRPIAQLKGSIRPAINMITAEIGKCRVSGGAMFSCFELRACVEYSGKFVNNTAVVETELTLDVNRVGENRGPRGFMFDGQLSVNNYSSLVQARKGHTTCENRLVYLGENLIDPLVPFAVRLDYRLRDTGDQRWCPTCPVPDRNFPLTVVRAIPYQHGCGSDDVCRADMKLDVNIVGYDGSPLVVGEQRDLSLFVFVENGRTADPAYLARVLITLPERVRVKSFCAPFAQASFLLKVDMSQVQDTFDLTAEATTTSEEAVPNDNKVVLTLPFIHQADISMLGKARPEVVTFNPATKSIQLEHRFVLAKQYASPIQQAELSIHVPYVFSESQQPIAYVKQIKIPQGDLFVPGTCRNVEGFVSNNVDQTLRNSGADSGSDVLSTKNGSLSGRVQRSVPEADSPHAERHTKLLYQNIPPLNCKTSMCHEVKCFFGPFLNRQKIAQVLVSVVVDMEEFTRQAGSWHAFSVGSEGYLKILDNTTFMPDIQSRKEIRVATVFQKEGPPPAQEVAAWIIAVSAFSGLVLFSLIIAGLIHVSGIFRRQKREALEKLLKEEDANEWNEFAVTKADVEAEKEFFRKSMMVGTIDFSVLQEEMNTSADDLKAPA
ncbi:hypothetical protein HPB48_020557 [Haemaphysalis longicornis]|uniref:Vitronectin receptor alpha subunit n=1 Tax=Haemaphysalis longicornis TaxID=44386 RepID=A0A9J6G5V8_HAELO|nr:hypothetical protein HPB48_020557 [Haemaphysalis longicornis]